jgi:DNA polymerase III delta subunit
MVSTSLQTEEGMEGGEEIPSERLHADRTELACMYPSQIRTHFLLFLKLYMEKQPFSKTFKKYSRNIWIDYHPVKEEKLVRIIVRIHTDF